MSCPTSNLKTWWNGTHAITPSSTPSDILSYQFYAIYQLLENPSSSTTYCPATPSDEMISICSLYIQNETNALKVQGLSLLQWLIQLKSTDQLNLYSNPNFEVLATSGCLSDSNIGVFSINIGVIRDDNANNFQLGVDPVLAGAFWDNYVVGLINYVLETSNSISKITYKVALSSNFPNIQTKNILPSNETLFLTTTPEVTTVTNFTLTDDANFAFDIDVVYGKIRVDTTLNNPPLTNQKFYTGSLNLSVSGSTVTYDITVGLPTITFKNITNESVSVIAGTDTLGKVESGQTSKISLTSTSQMQFTLQASDFSFDIDLNKDTKTPGTTNANQYSYDAWIAGVGSSIEIFISSVNLNITNSTNSDLYIWYDGTLQGENGGSVCSIPAVIPTKVPPDSPCITLSSTQGSNALNITNLDGFFSSTMGQIQFLGTYGSSGKILSPLVQIDPKDGYSISYPNGSSLPGGWSITGNYSNGVFNFELTGVGGGPPPPPDTGSSFTFINNTGSDVSLYSTLTGFPSASFSPGIGINPTEDKMGFIIPKDCQSCQISASDLNSFTYPFTGMTWNSTWNGAINNFYFETNNGNFFYVEPDKLDVNDIAYYSSGYASGSAAASFSGTTITLLSASPPEEETNYFKFHNNTPFRVSIGTPSSGFKQVQGQHYPQWIPGYADMLNSTLYINTSMPSAYYLSLDGYGINLNLVNSGTLPASGSLGFSYLIGHNNTQDMYLLSSGSLSGVCGDGNTSCVGTIPINYAANCTSFNTNCGNTSAINDDVFKVDCNCTSSVTNVNQYEISISLKNDNSVVFLNNNTNSPSSETITLSGQSNLDAYAVSRVTNAPPSNMLDLENAQSAIYVLNDTSNILTFNDSSNNSFQVSSSSIQPSSGNLISTFTLGGGGGGNTFNIDFVQVNKLGSVYPSFTFTNKTSDTISSNIPASAFSPALTSTTLSIPTSCSVGCSYPIVTESFPSSFTLSGGADFTFNVDFSAGKKPTTNSTSSYSFSGAFDGTNYSLEIDPPQISITYKNTTDYDIWIQGAIDSNFFTDSSTCLNPPAQGNPFILPKNKTCQVQEGSTFKATAITSYDGKNSQNPAATIFSVGAISFGSTTAVYKDTVTVTPSGASNNATIEFDSAKFYFQNTSDQDITFSLGSDASPFSSISGLTSSNASSFTISKSACASSTSCYGVVGDLLNLSNVAFQANATTIFNMDFALSTPTLSAVQGSLYTGKLTELTSGGVLISVSGGQPVTGTQIEFKNNTGSIIEIVNATEYDNFNSASCLIAPAACDPYEIPANSDCTVSLGTIATTNAILFQEVTTASNPFSFTLLLNETQNPVQTQTGVSVIGTYLNNKYTITINSSTPQENQVTFTNNTGYDIHLTGLTDASIFSTPPSCLTAPAGSNPWILPKTSTTACQATLATGKSFDGVTSFDGVNASSNVVFSLTTSATNATNYASLTITPSSKNPIYDFEPAYVCFDNSAQSDITIKSANLDIFISGITKNNDGTYTLSKSSCVSCTGCTTYSSSCCVGVIGPDLLNQNQLTFEDSNGNSGVLDFTKTLPQTAEGNKLVITPSANSGGGIAIAIAEPSVTNTIAFTNETGYDLQINGITSSFFDSLNPPSCLTGTTQVVIPKSLTQSCSGVISSCSSATEIASITEINATNNLMSSISNPFSASQNVDTQSSIYTINVSSNASTFDAKAASLTITNSAGDLKIIPSSSEAKIFSSITGSITANADGSYSVGTCTASACSATIGPDLFNQNSITIQDSNSNTIAQIDFTSGQPKTSNVSSLYTFSIAPNTQGPGLFMSVATAPVETILTLSNTTGYDISVPGLSGLSYTLNPNECLSSNQVLASEQQSCVITIKGSNLNNLTNFDVLHENTSVYTINVVNLTQNHTITYPGITASIEGSTISPIVTFSPGQIIFKNEILTSGDETNDLTLIINDTNAFSSITCSKVSTGYQIPSSNCQATVGTLLSDGPVTFTLFSQNQMSLNFSDPLLKPTYDSDNLIKLTTTLSGGITTLTFADYYAGTKITFSNLTPYDIQIDNVANGSFGWSSNLTWDSDANAYKISSGSINSATTASGYLDLINYAAGINFNILAGGVSVITLNIPFTIAQVVNGGAVVAKISKDSSGNYTVEFDMQTFTITNSTNPENDIALVTTDSSAINGVSFTQGTGYVFGSSCSSGCNIQLDNILNDNPKVVNFNTGATYNQNQFAIDFTSPNLNVTSADEATLNASLSGTTLTISTAVNYNQINITNNTPYTFSIGSLPNGSFVNPTGIQYNNSLNAYTFAPGTASGSLNQTIQNLVFNGLNTTNATAFSVNLALNSKSNQINQPNVVVTINYSNGVYSIDIEKASVTFINNTNPYEPILLATKDSTALNFNDTTISYQSGGYLIDTRCQNSGCAAVINTLLNDPNPSFELQDGTLEFTANFSGNQIVVSNGSLAQVMGIAQSNTITIKTSFTGTGVIFKNYTGYPVTLPNLNANDVIIDQNTTGFIKNSSGVFEITEGDLANPSTGGATINISNYASGISFSGRDSINGAREVFAFSLNLTSAQTISQTYVSVISEASSQVYTVSIYPQTYNFINRTEQPVEIIIDSSAFNISQNSNVQTNDNGFEIPANCTNTPSSNCQVTVGDLLNQSSIVPIKIGSEEIFDLTFSETAITATNPLTGYSFKYAQNSDNSYDLTLDYNPNPANNSVSYAIKGYLTQAVQDIDNPNSMIYLVAPSLSPVSGSAYLNMNLSAVVLNSDNSITCNPTTSSLCQSYNNLSILQANLSQVTININVEDSSSNSILSIKTNPLSQTIAPSVPQIMTIANANIFGQQPANSSNLYFSPNLTSNLLSIANTNIIPSNSFTQLVTQFPTSPIEAPTTGTISFEVDGSKPGGRTIAGFDATVDLFFTKNSAGQITTNKAVNIVPYFYMLGTGSLAGQNFSEPVTGIISKDATETYNVNINIPLPNNLSTDIEMFKSCSIDLASAEIEILKIPSWSGKISGTTVTGTFFSNSVSMLTEISTEQDKSLLSISFNLSSIPQMSYVDGISGSLNLYFG
jgi:hypothetical protein